MERRDALYTPVSDGLINAAIARLTGGLSPASLAAAYHDWAMHLALSPGKQQELATKAVRKWSRLMLYAALWSTGAARPVIEPLPQDRRFEHPYWKNAPFDLIHQAFLLMQQWWWNATTGVRGVTRHHEEVVTFTLRQLLDVFSPSNYLPTNPEVLAATWESGGANLVRGAANGWQDLLRQLGNQRPEGTEAYVPGRTVAVTPGKVILRNRLVELIQYTPVTTTVHAEPIFIVPSWIMKYYILDLSPGNSMVRWLLGKGHTVYILSWKNPTEGDRDLGMDDYLESGVLAGLDAIHKLQPRAKVHLVGYCLGGTLAAIAAATLAREGNGRLKSLSLLAAELDFREPGEMSLFIDESQIAYIEDIMWEHGYLDGKAMAGAFSMLNSKDLVWSRLVREYLMGERRPINDLMAWNADATRMPYRMHTEYLQRLYLANELAEGRYHVDGRPIALADIHLPMFVVGTERDHVSPWHSVYRAQLLTDTELTFLLTSGGHNVGIVNPPDQGPAGRYYRVASSPRGDRYIDPELWLSVADRHEGSWWPEWERWLADRSSGRSKPPGCTVPKAGIAPIRDAPGEYVLAE